MGNTHSERDSLPAYYRRGSGVEFGQRSRNSSLLSKSSVPPPEYIQLRQRKPTGQLKRQSAEVFDDDEDDNEEQASLISHGNSSDSDDNDNDNRSSLSPSLGLEIGVISDDTFSVPNSNMRHDSLTPSMKGNFSPSSLYEKNLRFSDSDHWDKDWSNTSGDRYLPVVPNDPNLAQSSVLLTPPSDDDAQIRPGHVSKLNSKNSLSEQNSNHLNNNESQEQKFKKNIYDKRYSFSDPVENDSFETMNTGNKDDYINTEMLIARLNSPQRESRQHLLQRLHEFAFSLSATNNTASNLSTPERKQRAFSLDRCDSDLGTPDAEVFNSENLDESSISNFGKIETEIKNIESEFAYLSSQLEKLKNNCSDEADDFSDFVGYTPSQPLSKRVCKIVQRAKTVLDSSSSISIQQEDSCDISDISIVTTDCDDQNDSESSKLDKSNNSVKDSQTKNMKTMDFAKSQGSTLVQDQPFNDAETCSASQTEEVNDIVTQSTDTLRVVSIGEKQEILNYARRQWKGQTKKADIMKEAYSKLPDLLQCDHLHSVRGDNYCGIRSSLFQIFVNGINLDHKLSSVEKVLETLHNLYNDNSSGLKEWDFAGRIEYQKDDHLHLMETCLSTLFSKLSEIQNLSSYEERELWTIESLNSDPNSELRMLEAVKLLMFMDSMQLYRDLQAMSDVPVFAWLMFARDTSLNPAMFIKNHLNQLGNSAGIEQVEMFLLGHALGIMIRVVRLQQLNQDDFVSYYPDEIREDWPQINLIAEDDRHYNAPVP